MSKLWTIPIWYWKNIAKQSRLPFFNAAFRNNLFIRFCFSEFVSLSSFHLTDFGHFFGLKRRKKKKNRVVLFLCSELCITVISCQFLSRRLMVSWYFSMPLRCWLRCAKKLKIGLLLFWIFLFRHVFLYLHTSVWAVTWRQCWNISISLRSFLPLLICFLLTMTCYRSLTNNALQVEKTVAFVN